MKKAVFQLIYTYTLFLLVFIIQKYLFMLWYHELYMDVSFTDCLAVAWNGLALDASTAGYLTIFPGLLLIAALWAKPEIIKVIRQLYFGFISLLISVIFVADLGLYKYWGFRLDSTPLFYLKSPKDAFASVGWLTVAGGLLAMILFAVLLFYVFNRLLIKHSKRTNRPQAGGATAGCLFLLIALLFIPIRGGVTVSTMNVGKVYFSSRLELNHAAINPCFSLMESLTREQNFATRFDFMEDAQALNLFNTLLDSPVTDTIPSLFTIEHPNIIVVVLESFMSKVIEPLGGIPDVAVRMNELCGEGVLFTNFYANSFRTDRGLVSIFSGYPAQPTTSIMKYPHKSQSLPSIPKSLKNAGYNLQYYYGGDADFTNMRSYLISCGIENIISDKDFPLKERLSKWGAHDEVVFARMEVDLKGEQTEPFLKILQTSSSHEPYDVDFHKLPDLYLNSVAYTDSCLGVFIDNFRQTRYWDNTVIVLVPDHAIRYPYNLDNHSVDRYKIPLLMVGGAIKSPIKIDAYASQIDIAATLLSQLNLPHSEFRFSKNILNPASPHFGYFTSPNLFGMITPDNQVVYDCDANKVTFEEGTRTDENLEKGKAFLQVLYDDLDKR